MLWITIGKSRKDIKWKNVEISWQDLVKRLSTAKKTVESVAEYKAMTKEKQGEAKDVGGFVGGIISGGHRLAKNVQSRSLITLDIDKPGDGTDAGEEFFEDFKMTWPSVSAVMHSTHSSYPGHLRYRLIIPLAAEVMTDEYEAIARFVAGTLDIEKFDATTFQPERLMFWPSVSRNGVYEFFEQKGRPMKAQDILGKYTDWTDMSQWPVHESVDRLIQKEIDKQQQNPLEKNNIVGTFCRTYSIEEAIEKYLGDIYEPVAGNDINGKKRYTYKHGSTAAGLVIYDDLYAYSHHNTDPVGGKLVNAFDLVRLSLFHEDDANVDPKTNAAKYPSFKKMNELALKDKKVKRLVIEEKTKDAINDFTNEALSEIEIDEKGELQDYDWREKLEMDNRKNILPTINNMVLIFENDERLRGKFAFDDFSKQQFLTGNMFYRKVKEETDKWITDADLAHIEHYIEHVYKINGEKRLEKALTIICEKYKKHPVVEYLKSIKWDGRKRLEKMLVVYMGADDTLYTRAVTVKVMVAAVARVFEPGCKFDNMLILKGKQGIGKSWIFDRLGGKWFSDSFGNVHNKDTLQQIQGSWIIEMPELSAMRRSDAESIKAFVAKRIDKFRVAFGKLVGIYPRQCIFIGTTNEDEFLKDYTGNRRFWIVAVDTELASKDVFKLTDTDRDQIWAEAVQLYLDGEELFLNNEVKEEAEKIQELYVETEAAFEAVSDYLKQAVPKDWYQRSTYDKLEFLNNPNDNLVGKPEIKRNKITLTEIWMECIRGDLKNLTNFNTAGIKRIMKKMPGWEQKVIKINGKTIRGWYCENPEIFEFL